MPTATVPPAVQAATAELVRAVARLVDAVRGAAPADAVAARAPGQRGPGKNNPKLKAAVKASWANYTPAQRAARIAKMLAGRGLKPKGRRPARRNAGGTIVRSG